MVLPTKVWPHSGGNLSHCLWHVPLAQSPLTLKLIGSEVGSDLRGNNMSLARLDLFSQKLINPHKSNYFPAGYVPLSCPLMSQASTAFHHWHAWSMRTLLEMALPLELWDERTTSPSRLSSLWSSVIAKVNELIHHSIKYGGNPLMLFRENHYKGNVQLTRGRQHSTGSRKKTTLR